MTFQVVYGHILVVHSSCHPSTFTHKFPLIPGFLMPWNTLLSYWSQLVLLVSLWSLPLWQASLSLLQKYFFSVQPWPLVYVCNTMQTTSYLFSVFLCKILNLSNILDSQDGVGNQWLSACLVCVKPWVWSPDGGEQERKAGGMGCLTQFHKYLLIDLKNRIQEYLHSLKTILCCWTDG